MQTRTIKKVVDSLATQRRIVLYMDCGHYISINERDMRTWPREAIPQLVAGNQFTCHTCADLPPTPEEPMDPLEAFHRASFGGRE